ncbi:MAG: bifunctional diaminohydroxyphosphoribosylaminopyrimidine deaminase/5-amino-6-(5-phosphoribosylamino)uracil reductase RibD [Alphaproteobacteria bacterium]
MNDDRFMRMAVGLARRGHGNVAPNPSVGCVIVRDGCVVGRGWTRPGGRPHAETEALAQAGAAAAGADVYVTLEPCAHHGETPPCAEALIDAGVGRVIIGAGDPDPRVDGGGISMLRAAGIAVVEGCCAGDAKRVAEGFLRRVRDGRPMVTVKAATSLDGRIATSTGASQWITGEISRALGHGMRARHDAIMVGGATALADNPSLTCRLPGLENASPARVVVCGAAPVPAEHALVATASRTPTIFITGDAQTLENREACEAAGVSVIEVGTDTDGNVDIIAALAALGGQGITRLMVEGGGRLISALFRADLVDRLVWFRAPKVIGGDGIPVASAFGVAELDGAANFVNVSARPAGDDLVETYMRKD